MTTKETYRAYLRTSNWQNKKLQLFKKVGKYCYVCGSTEKLDVHHLRYRELVNVRSKDLIPLCHSCHRIAHHLVDQDLITKKSSRDDARSEIERYLKVSSGSWLPKQRWSDPVRSLFNKPRVPDDW